MKKVEIFVLLFCLITASFPVVRLIEKCPVDLIRVKSADPTTCPVDLGGKCSDYDDWEGYGSIQIWSLKPGWGSRPDIYVGKAHTDDITSFKFSSDGRILLSRSFDGSLKVWDLRLMKEALKAFDGLPNNYSQTNVAFSPDEQIILTGI